MRAGIVVNVTRADRHRLEAIVSDRCAPQKHVWRAQIILATAAGCSTAEIMRRSGKAKPVVWTWQARFMSEGVDGLLRDKTRKPGKAPLPAETVQLVIDLVTGPPPGEATHWTGRMLAKAAGGCRSDCAPLTLPRRRTATFAAKLDAATIALLLEGPPVS
jgi:hypothetical protein